MLPFQASVMVSKPARWQQTALSLEILVQLWGTICLFNTTARKVRGRGLSTPKLCPVLCSNTENTDIYLKNHCSILREEARIVVTTKNRYKNIDSLS